MNSYIFSMGYVYLITNTINGKRYVGQSQQIDIEKRWSAHRSMSPNNVGSYLYAAYKKYGIENFKFQIICICFDEDCDTYENEYIQKFNTMRPGGYNLKTGGNNVKYSEESRKLISRRLKETMTAERRKHMSEIRKGKKVSETTKKLMSIKHKENWQNMTIEEKTNITEKRKNNPKYENAIKALQHGADINKKRVGRFDKNNKLLEEYESMSHAARATNICQATISCVCRKVPRYKTAGGFIWKFI
jgi:group I intron endonuclease